MPPESEVEFHRRGLGMFYFVVAIIAIALGILFLMVGLGEGVRMGSGSEKWVSVGQWCLGGFVWLLASPKLWTMGRAYIKNLVRFGGTDVLLHTLSGHEYRIPYASIRGIEWEPSMRKRLLTIHTAETKYQFDQRSTPSIAKVAEMLQDRVAPTRG